MPSFYRVDGQVQTPQGPAVAGASVAVLQQPADFSTQPGSPLQAIYAANASNSATVSSASWSGGQITFELSSTPPDDVVEGSYIGVSGVSPSTYNSTLEAPWLVLAVDGDNVIVAALTNPGAYGSGGTIATSVLPNPTETDNNGNYFFYATPGIYSVQIYSPTITERDLPDQDVGATGAGTVTSVAMNGDGVIFGTITGSPITTSGTLDLSTSLLTQSANSFLAGPTSGSPAAPTFRSITSADLPDDFGTVTSVALSLSLPSFLSVVISGSPVTTTGTLTGTVTLATQTANTVFAGPASGGASAPTFRALVPADFQNGGQLQTPVTPLTGTADALSFPGTYIVTTAGVDNMTLAQGTQALNGAIVTVISSGAHAHTITTGANGINGAYDTVTFNGDVGSFVQLINYGQTFDAENVSEWWMLASSGVTLSEV